MTKIQPQGEFQPGVAYKSVPYKKKRVIHEDGASKYVSRLEEKKDSGTRKLSHDL